MRLVPAVLLLGVFLLLEGRGPAPLGLRARPVQGWRWWVRATALLAGGMVVLMALGAAVLALAGRELPTARLFQEPADFGPWALAACVWAPVAEELVYRFALVLPALRWLGGWGAVLLSGAVFAGLHFAYGTAGLDNFFAGYVLGWAYLRSGCLLVPVALHALGNLAVGLLHLGLCLFAG